MHEQKKVYEEQKKVKQKFKLTNPDTTGIPAQMKQQFENISQLSFDDVRVHYNSCKPAKLQALAYTQGNQVFIGPGKEKYLKHELGHVVQQKSGIVKPNTYINGLPVNDNMDLENAAETYLSMTNSRKEDRKTDENNSTIQLYPRSVYIDGEKYNIRAAKMKLIELYGNKLVMAQINYYFELLEPEIISFSNWNEFYIDIIGREMKDIIKYEGYNVDDYKIPLLHENINSKKGRQIQEFNHRITEIASMEPIPGPFTVCIKVGDLKGLGDISAGAKLAVELFNFYQKYKIWKNVKVQFFAVRDSSEDKDNVRISSLIEGILSGSSVERINADGINADVCIAYPAHNIDGDFSIQQYGYKQFGADRDYGSGPGFGSLGIISPSDDVITHAINNADSPVRDSKLDWLKTKTADYPQIHFAYFSIYQDRYKDFVKHLDIKSKTAIVFTRYEGSLNSIADALNDNLKQNLIYNEIVSNENDYKKLKPKKKNDKALQKLRENGIKMKYQIDAYVYSEKDKEKQIIANHDIGRESILLINFIDGVNNSDMLSLYYLSTGEVGATGDQSFVEAYTMRRQKTKYNQNESSTVLYDVPEQQRPLYTQLLELQTGRYKAGLEPPGIKTICVNEKINKAFDKKKLLYPTVMLINEKLGKKKT